MSSGFRRQVAENCFRLGYYATSNKPREAQFSSHPRVRETNNLSWLRTHGSSQKHELVTRLT